MGGCWEASGVDGIVGPGVGRLELRPRSERTASVETEARRFTWLEGDVQAEREQERHLEGEPCAQVGAVLIDPERGPDAEARAEPGAGR